MTTATVPSFVLSLCEYEIKNAVIKCLDVVAKTYNLPREEMLAIVENEVKLTLTVKPEKPVKPVKGETKRPLVQRIPRVQCCALFKSNKAKSIVQCTRKTTGEFCPQHEVSRKHGTIERI